MSLAIIFHGHQSNFVGCCCSVTVKVSFQMCIFTFIEDVVFTHVHACTFFQQLKILPKKHEKHILAHAHICKSKIAAAFNRILYTKLLFFTRNFVQFEAGH